VVLVPTIHFSQAERRLRMPFYPDLAARKSFRFGIAAGFKRCRILSLSQNSAKVHPLPIDGQVRLGSGCTGAEEIGVPPAIRFEENCMLRMKLATVVALAAVSCPSQLLAGDSCTKISGHISGQIIGPNAACGGALTEIGSFTGNPEGTFVACVTNMFVACVTNMKDHGGGVLVFKLVHTYTTTSGDTFTTSDNIVAHPINPPLYRVENHATITGGTGVYEDAVGFSYDQGTVDLGTGVVSVDYQGRICTP
jgi:hypothetical protein